RFQSTVRTIIDFSGSIVEFARMHEYYGVHFEKMRNGWVYREWAPAAKQLFLTGDFNWWDRESHPMRRNHRGDWEIFLPFEEYKHTFVHKSKIKVRVVGANDVSLDRIPAYIRRVVQDEATLDFSGQLWFETAPFSWSDHAFSLHEAAAMP